MARKAQSRGTCTFCGKEMAKGGLSRHLKSCAGRKEAIELRRTDAICEFAAGGDVRLFWSSGSAVLIINGRKTNMQKRNNHDFEEANR